MTKQKNDEARMTNDEGMTKLEIRMELSSPFTHSSFGFPSCFVIRHSDFRAAT